MAEHTVVLVPGDGIGPEVTSAARRVLTATGVVLAPFQYGDILADLCAGLAGGLGMAPGASFGDSAALFEAAHGSAPKYAGKDVANPAALVLSGALLLDHIGENAAADRVRRAVADVIEKGTTTTRDLGGNAGTTAMTEAIISALTVSGGQRSAP